MSGLQRYSKPGGAGGCGGRTGGIGFTVGARGGRGTETFGTPTGFGRSTQLICKTSLDGRCVQRSRADDRRNRSPHLARSGPRPSGRPGSSSWPAAYSKALVAITATARRPKLRRRPKGRLAAGDSTCAEMGGCDNQGCHGRQAPPWRSRRRVRRRRDRPLRRASVTFAGFACFVGSVVR